MSQDTRIKKIVDLMQSDDSIDAPAEAVKWVKNLCFTREQKSSLLRRIVAVLKADLLPDSAVLGERSGSAAQARQMFFAADDHGIDMRITGRRNGFSIRGQVLGVGFENASVSLAGKEASFAARTDENAIFALSDVPSGGYELILTGDQTELSVEHIEL